MLGKEANYPRSCTADDDAYVTACMIDLESGKEPAVVGTLPPCNGGAAGTDATANSDMVMTDPSAPANAAMATTA